MLRDGRSYLAEAFVGLGATVYGTFDRKEGSGYLFRYIRVEGVQAREAFCRKGTSFMDIPRV